MNNQPLANIIRKIAWGYILSFFNIDINLNSVTIHLIPHWIGSFMLYQSLTPLSEYEKSAELLKPLQLIVTIYDLAWWVLAFFGIQFDVYPIRVVFAIIDVYFNFQLMTNIATIANRNGYLKANHMLILRTLKVIAVTLTALPVNWTGLSTIHFPVVLDMESLLVSLTVLIGIIYLIFTLIVEISILYHLFDYAKYEQERMIVI